MHADPNVLTVHLGQFSREEANRIAEGLERAGIVWWYKEPGFFSQIWELGVRLFVDKTRLSAAREIVAGVQEESSQGADSPDVS
jgi:hypothetical protein